MIGWIVRLLMMGGGVVTGWILARDAPLFGTVQILVTLTLMALIVALVAFWPSHLNERLRRLLSKG